MCEGATRSTEKNRRKKERQINSTQDGLWFYTFRRFRRRTCDFQTVPGINNQRSWWELREELVTFDCHAILLTLHDPFSSRQYRRPFDRAFLFRSRHP